MALLAYAFDASPDPNKIISCLGWLWAILGLVVASTFLTQWVFQAPTGIEVLRRQVRQFLVDAERACLIRAFGTGSGFSLSCWEEELGDALGRAQKLRTAGVLSPFQEDNCERLLLACGTAIETLTPNVSSIEHHGTDNTGTASSRRMKCSTLIDVAACVRRLRLEVLSGRLSQLPARWPDTSDVPPSSRSVIEAFVSAEDHLRKQKDNNPPKLPSGLFLVDWKTNPAYTDFALRAMMATMACYLFMTLVNWNGIHTCMITCAVTALAGVGLQRHKQNLRMAGALLGGVMGIGTVVFVIPHLGSLAAFLGMLTIGTFLASWVSLGSERISYAGWQIGLAFYMTILQDPHPTTKLDIIRDRWVGIFVGILAMRAAFSWIAPPVPRPEKDKPELRSWR